MSLIITSCGGACPTQAEGTMEGLPFYFRARHGDWTLVVAKPGHDVLDAHWDQEKALHWAEGLDETLGWMEPKDVESLIGLYYHEWFRIQTPQPLCGCGKAPALWGPDPYAHDIHDDDTPVWLCEECRAERAGDI